MVVMIDVGDWGWEGKMAHADLLPPLYVGFFVDQLELVSNHPPDLQKKFDQLKLNVHAVVPDNGSDENLTHQLLEFLSLWIFVYLEKTLYCSKFGDSGFETALVVPWRICGTVICFITSRSSIPKRGDIMEAGNIPPLRELTLGSNACLLGLTQGDHLIFIKVSEHKEEEKIMITLEFWLEKWGDGTPNVILHIRRKDDEKVVGY
ncbi:hypothetical protein E3N88_22381 [Mikania micrantha]|uniref:Uncharacterized protein n=1 Tax=Mikania micrantha TaxID=192012 RepID=A0A5N6NC31_9ASTR|nr:hypothetical protein E3N88_22381 [Mikania micrantha]